MKYIVKCSDGDFAVYSDLAFDGDSFSGDPEFKGDLFDCKDYCSDDASVVFRRGFFVPEFFVSDLERRLDRLRFRVLASFSIVSDVVYERCSDRYMYVGVTDHAHVVMRDGTSFDRFPVEAKLATDVLNQLIAISNALSELGFSVTFDSKGKHKIFSHSLGFWSELGANYD